jgi:5-methylcytosine-specific restriction endonuclease McrA
MSIRKQQSLSKRLGVSLVESPDIKSPASLLCLIRDLRKQDDTLFSYEKWLAFRDTYFAEIMERDGCIRCAYCQADLIAETDDDKRLATIDHIIPIAKNGAMWDKANMVSACLRCNQNKGDEII